VSGYLVIFDCDGVLVDSERLIQRVDQELVRELGWPMTPPEIYDQLVGRSTRDVITNVERHTGRSLPEDWGSKRSRAHREVLAKEPAPVPGVVGAVAGLEEKGYAICVGSSGSPAAIRNSLQLTGLWEGFEGHVFSAEDVERGKPAPDLFLHAAAAMGYRPESCTVVEDSQLGSRLHGAVRTHNAGSSRRGRSRRSARRRVATQPRDGNRLGERAMTATGRIARITADMCVARPKLATASEPARRRAALSGAVCES